MEGLTLIGAFLGGNHSDARQKKPCSVHVDTTCTSGQIWVIQASSGSTCI
jgi:hypothetical protein